MAKKEKVECQYCGKEYSPRGIKTHENSCSENPENQEEVSIKKAEKEEPEEVEEEIEEEIKDEDIVSQETRDKVEEEDNDDDVVVDESAKSSRPAQVHVKLREDLRVNVGGEWYDFKKDKRYSVSPNVKDILSERDLLKPL